MEKRKRNIQIKFRVTEEEKQRLIKSADDYCANAQKHK